MYQIWRRSEKYREDPAESAYLSAILEVIQTFDKEVLELKKPSDYMNDIGTNEEKENLMASALKFQEFQKEMSDTMSSLNQDIHGLKNALLESFCIVEEANSKEKRKNDHVYISMLKERALDPISAKRMDSIKQMSMYLGTQLQEVQNKLDLDWFEFLERKKKQRTTRIQSTDAIYKTISKNRQTIHFLEKTVESLEKKANERKRENIYKRNMYRSKSQFQRADNEDLSKLADAFLKTKINTYEEEKPVQPKKISAKAHDFIKNFLSSAKIRSLHPTVINSPSQSRLLSKCLPYNKCDTDDSDASLAEYVKGLEKKHPGTDDYIVPLYTPNKEDEALKKDALQSPLSEEDTESPLYEDITPPDSPVLSKYLQSMVGSKTLPVSLKPCVSDVQQGISSHISINNSTSKKLEKSSLVLDTKQPSMSLISSLKTSAPNVSPFSGPSIVTPQHSFKLPSGEDASKIMMPQAKPLESTFNLQSKPLSEKPDSTPFSSFFTPPSTFPNFTSGSSFFSKKEESIFKPSPLTFEPAPSPKTTAVKSENLSGLTSPLSSASHLGSESVKSGSLLVSQKPLGSDAKLDGFKLTQPSNNTVATSGSEASFFGKSPNVTKGSIVFPSAIFNTTASSLSKFSFTSSVGEMKFPPTTTESTRKVPEEILKENLGTPTSVSLSLQPPAQTPVNLNQSAAASTLGNFKTTGSALPEIQSSDSSTLVPPDPQASPAARIPVTGSQSETVVKPVDFSFGQAQSVVPASVATSDLSVPQVSAVPPTPSMFGKPAATTQPSVISTSSFFGGGVAATTPATTSVVSQTVTQAPSLLATPSTTTVPTSIVNQTVLQSPLLSSPTTTAASTTSLFSQSPGNTTSSFLDQAGKSSFFTKPADAPSFGLAPSLFGSSAETTTSAASVTQTSSFFSQPTAVFGTPSTTSGTSVFGGTPSSTSGTSVFGGTPSTTSGTSVFGGTPSTTSGTSSFGVAPSGPDLRGVAPSEPSVLGGTPSATSGTSVFGGTPATTTSPAVFGETPSTTTPTPVFGATPATTTATPVFGATPTTSTGTSVFGATPTTTTGTSVFGGTPTTTAGTSVFGGTAVAPAGISVFGSNPESSTGNSVFGGTTGGTSVFGSQSNIKSPFGQNQGSFGLAKSVFGQQNSNTSAPVFGQPASPSSNLFPFGQAPESGFGQGSFFSGLGGKPSAESASKNVFSVGNLSTQPSESNAFGATTFGGVKPGTFTGGSFSSGGQSVAQSGFGAFQTTPQKTGGFGAAPAFGGAPAFGSPPAFGSGPTFGGSSLGAVFGSSQTTQNASFSNFASASSPTFGSLASQSPGGFGSANQPTFGQSSPFGGTPAFGGAPSFGGQPSSGFGASSSTSGASAFTQWRN